MIKRILYALTDFVRRKRTTIKIILWGLGGFTIGALLILCGAGFVNWGFDFDDLGWQGIRTLMLLVGSVGGVVCVAIGAADEDRR